MSVNFKNRYENRIAFGFISFALCALFPNEITVLFMKATPEVTAIAPNIIRVYAISFFPMAVSLFITAYLQSVTKAASATVISLLRGVILPSVLLYVLPLFFQSSGIWWAVTIAETITAIAAAAYVKPELNRK